MNHWLVVSPEMTYVEPILDDGSGPTEIWREVVYAEAETKRDAIDVGVRVMKYWPTEARQDFKNPWAGVTADLAECEHGFCWCELDDCARGNEANGHGDYCEVCMREHDEVQND